jgi:uncharacterized protein YndB with AHSA1/START domain
MTSATALSHTLERSILIRARREIVFRFFTDSARWAAWWGAGSTIDPRPGGHVFIRYPGGTEVSGEIVEIDEPQRIVFTYGFVAGTPIPPGASLVTIALEREPAGTRVRLSHAFAEAQVRDEHVQGWRYQLSVFANVVTDELHAKAADLVDGWFDAWAETDAQKRLARLAAVASPDVRMHDRYSCIDGAGELTHHIAASQRFMPGFRLRRAGDLRHCQGAVLADWTASGPDGQVRAQGSTVFGLGADGRIESVTGFWK